MPKPQFDASGKAAAWGDLAEVSLPQIKNLFAVSLRLPKALTIPYAGGSKVISMLAKGVTLPEETLNIIQVETKLSNYDVVVGKNRGELGITFLEQVGQPVYQLLTAWQKLIVDPRNKGIGWPADYRTDIWIAALTGDGKPYYWWGHRKGFPTSKGAPTFANDDKTQQELVVPFSYLEIIDSPEALAGEGANMANRAAAAATQIGL
jgi:hypothetical protein